MNKNLSALLKAAVVSGFVAGSIAYADDHTTPPAEGASAPKAEGEKKAGKAHKGKHAHGDKKAKGANGCNGKDGCEGKDKPAEEAPK